MIWSQVVQRGSESQIKYSRPQPKDDDEDGLDEDDEQGETLCGACGENYASDEFWICCDICEVWFHGKCVKITPARAEHIKQYKCPSCTSSKRTRPWLHLRYWGSSFVKSWKLLRSFRGMRSGFLMGSSSMPYVLFNITIIYYLVARMLLSSVFF